MNRNELIKEIRKNQRKINRSYMSYKKELNGKKSGFLTTMEARFRQITGAKKGREKNTLPIGDMSRMRKKKLVDLLAAQREFMSSVYFTKKSRIELRKKKKETLEERYGISLSGRQYNKMIDFFNENPTIYQELTETKDFGSDQVVELFEDGMNVKKLLNAFKIIEAKKWTKIKKGHWRVFIQELAQGDIKNERKLLEIYKRHKS